jgi:hypothetical protein
MGGFNPLATTWHVGWHCHQQALHWQLALSLAAADGSSCNAPPAPSASRCWSRIPITSPTAAVLARIASLQRTSCPPKLTAVVCCLPDTCTLSTPTACCVTHTNMMHSCASAHHHRLQAVTEGGNQPVRLLLVGFRQGCCLAIKQCVMATVMVQYKQGVGSFHTRNVCRLDASQHRRRCCCSHCCPPCEAHAAAAGLAGPTDPGLELLDAAKAGQTRGLGIR